MKQTTNYKLSLIEFANIKYFIIAFCTFLLSCEFEEINSLKTDSGLISSSIQDYLNSLSIEKKENSYFTVGELKSKIDYNSIKSLALNTAQTLLIADLKPIFKDNKITKTKIIFYLQKNKIITSKIFTF